MTLASPEVIRSLKRGFEEGSAGEIPARSQSMRCSSRRCACGKCHYCRENARWNRIFAEKFADPSYYRGLVLRSESPLRSF